MSTAELPASWDAAAVFAALGDRTRLALLDKLSDGLARSIASLTTDTAVTRQAITKHLRVLETAGLVHQTRFGRESRYALRPEQFMEARAYLDRVSAEWDGALARLKVLVES